MFFKHPFEDTLINSDAFEEIKCCTVNLTHVDFYTEILPKGVERGEPDLTISFETQEERDEWFESLVEMG